MKPIKYPNLIESSFHKNILGDNFVGDCEEVFRPSWNMVWRIARKLNRRRYGKYS